MENVVDLGAVMDNKLKFSSHINGIVSKAHKRANLIIRCVMSRDLSSLVRSFKNRDAAIDYFAYRLVNVWNRFPILLVLPVYLTVEGLLTANFSRCLKCRPLIAINVAYSGQILMLLLLVFLCSAVCTFFLCYLGLLLFELINMNE